MSDQVSALADASFDGIARVEEAGLQGMVTFRGDLDDAAVKKAVKAATGVAVPGQRGIGVSGENAVAWMSPDELLLIGPHGQADAMVAALEKTLAGKCFLAVNVSDARAVFDVRGGHARDVLAKLMPVDFSALAFRPGMIRRSRLAQVPAAVWMTGEDAFRLVCFRSVARYVFDVLSAAAGDGSEVEMLV